MNGKMNIPSYPLCLAPPQHMVVTLEMLLSESKYEYECSYTIILTTVLTKKSFFDSDREKEIMDEKKQEIKVYKKNKAFAHIRSPLNLTNTSKVL